MKITIITVCFNSEQTIGDTLASVDAQTYPDIEHLIIDGASRDRTLEIIAAYAKPWRHVLSERDQGIYDAMNKGLALATGDVIGILNSDDIYAHDEVIAQVVSSMQNTDRNCCFADLVYTDDLRSEKVLRYYSSKSFDISKFEYGWMPAHPTVFIRSWAYKKYGLFRTDFKIAADFELMVRFLAIHHLTYVHIPEIWVKMRIGGISTAGFSNTLILNQEIVRACRDNGISTNIVKVMSKYFTKIFELTSRFKFNG